MAKPVIRMPHTEHAWSEAVIVGPFAIGMLLANPTRYHDLDAEDAREGEGNGEAI